MLYLIPLFCLVYNLYSPRIGFVGCKKFTSNLDFCGLQVHDPRLSYWEVWYDQLELLQTCSKQNFTSGIFIFQNDKMRGSSMMKNSYVLEPYAWSLQWTNRYTCCLLSFWALSNVVTVVSSFSCSHDRDHIHTTSFAKLSTPGDSNHMPPIKLPHKYSTNM